MKKISTCLLMFLLLVPVIGCKVRITVPTGGSVVSSSGALDCDEGDTCSFDVVDVFFKDTFVGVPSNGFAFAGWKRGKDTLCGGSAKDCLLSTGGFVGNPDLLAVLESDRVFFLTPVFIKKIGPGNVVNRPFTACLDRSMFEDGYRSDITRQLYDNGRKEGTRRTVRNVTGPSSYKGKRVMTLHESVTDRGVFNSELEITSYNQVDLAALRVRTIGIDQAFITPAAPDVEGTISPAFLQRFDLKVGDSYTTTYEIRLNFADGSSPDIVQNISTEFIYEGVERITIPAGSFQACRLRRFDDIDGLVSESYNWIGQDNGVLLLESDADFVFEAAVTKGSSNGKAL